MSETFQVVTAGQLPLGWATIRLSELRRTRAKSFRPSSYGAAKFELYSVPSHRVGEPEILASAEIGSNKQFLNEGDVLISKINPRLNRTWLVPATLEHTQIGSTEWVVFPKAPFIEGRWLMRVLQDVRLRDYLCANASGVGGSLTRVRPALFDSIEIALPPLNEQRRIVDKIEQLFDLLDKGEESLRAARDKAGLYRQSLLKHAFEGHLTADWRAANPDKLEDPQTLLARIQAERDARYTQALDDWRDALAKWRAEGEEGKKPKKPKALPDIAPPTKAELEGCPRVPTGWAYLNVASLCDVVRGGSPRPAGDDRYYNGEIPFLKVADLTRKSGPYVDSYTYTIKPAGLTKTRLVEPKTLLISNSGATLGVPKICTIPATFNDGIAAFLGLDESTLKYHLWFWSSKTKSLRQINQGAAQPNLNTSLIGETLIPLCSPAEQAEIVSRLEAKLSTLDALEADIDAQLARARALRQSILKRAFEGKLVPQDPADEPASALLERIQAERAAAPKAKRKRKVKA